MSVISPRFAHTLRQCFELDTAYVGNRRVANRSWKSAHALSAAKVRQTMGSHASLEMNERRSRKSRAGHIPTQLSALHRAMFLSQPKLAVRAKHTSTELGFVGSAPASPPIL